MRLSGCFMKCFLLLRDYTYICIRRIPITTFVYTRINMRFAKNKRLCGLLALAGVLSLCSCMEQNNPDKKVCLSFYDEDYIPEVYGLSELAASLDAKPISMSMLSVFYTVIGL